MPSMRGSVVDYHPPQPQPKSNLHFQSNNVYINPTNNAALPVKTLPSVAINTVPEFSKIKPNSIKYNNNNSESLGNHLRNNLLITSNHMSNIGFKIAAPHIELGSSILNHKPKITLSNTNLLKSSSTTSLTNLEHQKNTKFNFTFNNQSNGVTPYIFSSKPK